MTVACGTPLLQSPEKAVGTQAEDRMKVGTIKETKIEEYRVGLTPTGVRALTEAGHEVLVERDAGIGSGYPDAQYATAGAKVLASAGEVAATVDLLVKVKEPLEPEFGLLRPGLDPVHVPPPGAGT